MKNLMKMVRWCFRMVHSLNKGKSFERDIANMLSRMTGAKFLRVPMSGGFATTNKSNDARFDGDVFSENDLFKDLVIECKNHAIDINLNDLNSEKSVFWSWVNQAVNESQGKRWLLFIKLTRKGTYLACKNTTSLEPLGILTKRFVTLTRNNNLTVKITKLK